MEGFVNVTTVLSSGVYALVHRGTVVYIGKAKALYSRIYTHRNLYRRRAPTWLPPSARGMLFDEVWVQPCPLHELDALERQLIARYSPKNNFVHRPPAAPREMKPVINGVPLTCVVRAEPRFERRV